MTFILVLLSVLSYRVSVREHHASIYCGVILLFNQQRYKFDAWKRNIWGKDNYSALFTILHQTSHFTWSTRTTVHDGQLETSLAQVLYLDIEVFPASAHYRLNKWIVWPQVSQCSVITLWEKEKWSYLTLCSGANSNNSLKLTICFSLKLILLCSESFLRPNFPPTTSPFAFPAELDMMFSSYDTFLSPPPSCRASSSSSYALYNTVSPRVCVIGWYRGRLSDWSSACMLSVFLWLHGVLAGWN